MISTKSGIIFIISALFLAIGTIPAISQDVTEHPLIRPFPDSILDERRSEYQSFGEYDFRVGTARNYEVHTIMGEFRSLRYLLYNDDGSPNREVSQLEYVENFKTAALERGGEIKWEDRHYGLVFTIPRENGGITWCRLTATPAAGRHDLFIIDESPLETSLEFGAAQMKAALDSDGRITLYGILFDYDKATLQQSSNDQLQEVLTLLLQYPELSLEIQGHTDSDGSEAYNLQLSQQRSESVLGYLVLFGVESSRLQAKGYGESTPVAPNDTDENKAKNRRVELQRIDLQ
ncbi:MAG: OmpA family protein [Balneolaceae bacterium]|nr:MAG: OmpA family protein [Balneolaceae bacterium]